MSATLCICARAASTICSGHPSAPAATATFSMTRLPFFPPLSMISLRQVDIALRAAFTASHASSVSPGTVTGLNFRGFASPTPELIDASPLVGFSSGAGHDQQPDDLHRDDFD